MPSSRFIMALLLLSPSATELKAQSSPFRIDQTSQWQEWTFPPKTLELKEDGSVTPLRFDGPVNVALDANQYFHKVNNNDWQGGVRRVGSSPATAANVIDGRRDTYWQPDAADSLESWMIDIDLGRVVPATLIRLHFPDQEGARPLREFRVFATDGKLQSSLHDIFLYNLVGGTTKWNDETVIEFPLASGDRFRRRVSRLGTASAETDTATSFEHIQYLRVLADAKSPDAALSEVEVLTYSENLAVGLLDRGGSTDDQGMTGRAISMIDGNVNTALNRNYESSRHLGVIRYDWDLGAVYWITRALFVADTTPPSQGSPGLATPRILGSDGRLSPRQSAPGERAPIDYDVLFDYVPNSDWNRPSHLTYFLQPYRRLRHLAMTFQIIDYDYFEPGVGALAEAAFFATGHVAEVTMTSDFIRIADRPKILKTLSWEADTPSGTRILANSRSGNTFVTRTIHYDRNGMEVSADTYENMRKSKRGDTVVSEPGDDWSPWSATYQASGQRFLSPSPRRFVQLRLNLSSERPEIAPTLNSILLDFDDAILAGATGAVHPRQAEPGVAQTFKYTLIPNFRSGDIGFDRILVQTPAMAERDSLVVRIDGSPVDALQASISRDSLLLQLPSVVQQAALEIDIHVPVLQNPFLFNAFVGHSSEPDLWQPVDARERHSLTVFVPEIAESEHLIEDVSVIPPVMTPNGDGVGDRTRIRFAVLKTNAPARVTIFSLDGTLVRDLEGGIGVDGYQVYGWSGTNRSGTLVLPGIYLCSIELEAQARSETVARVLNVAY